LIICAFTRIKAMNDQKAKQWGMWCHLAAPIGGILGLAIGWKIYIDYPSVWLSFNSFLLPHFGKRAAMRCLWLIIYQMGSTLGSLILLGIVINKNSFVNNFSKKSLNFQLSMLAYLIGFNGLSIFPLLKFLFVGLIPSLWFFTLIVPIIGAIQARRGKYYRTPLTMNVVIFFSGNFPAFSVEQTANHELGTSSFNQPSEPILTSSNKMWAMLCHFSYLACITILYVLRVLLIFLSGYYTPVPPSPLWTILGYLILLIFLLVLASHILLPLMIWLTQKNKHPFIDICGKESLNFQISMTLYFAPFFAIAPALQETMFWSIGAAPPGMPVVPLLARLIALMLLILLVFVPLVWLILPIVAAIKAIQGKYYRYPFTIRFFQ
jgi:uncharacterized Tic20 family protein